MGLTEENWPAAVGIFTGIFAKEAVVGTLDALYAQMDSVAAPATADSSAADTSGRTPAEVEATAADEEESFDFAGGIAEAFATIPANLAGVADTFLDPLGVSIGDVSDQAAAAEDQEVAQATFGAMLTLFDGRIGAFAYLPLVLLYILCVAAIAAIYRETDLRWTLFACAWNAGLAYAAAVVFYQLATITRHPVTSVVWVGIIAAVALAVMLVLRWFG